MNKWCQICTSNEYFLIKSILLDTNLNLTRPYQQNLVLIVNLTKLFS